jgi:high-affinity Fe2+/Pb2+ permease
MRAHWSPFRGKSKASWLLLGGAAALFSLAGVVTGRQAALTHSGAYTAGAIVGTVLFGVIVVGLVRLAVGLWERRRETLMSPAALLIAGALSLMGATVTSVQKSHAKSAEQTRNTQSCARQNRSNELTGR